MARLRPVLPEKATKEARHDQAGSGNIDDEAGDTDSQQMLALGSLLKGPKSDEREAQQFRSKVDLDKKNMKTLLGKHIGKVKREESRRRSELASAFLAALQVAQTADQASTIGTSSFSGTRIATNTAYSSIANVVKASEHLCRKYEKLDKLNTSMYDEQTILMTEAWNQDIENIERKLKLGARVALRNAKKVLGAEIKDRDGEMATIEVEEEEKELDDELHKRLNYAERGVKRMVKGLCMEDRS